MSAGAACKESIKERLLLVDVTQVSPQPDCRASFCMFTRGGYPCIYLLHFTRLYVYSDSCCALLHVNITLLRHFSATHHVVKKQVGIEAGNSDKGQVCSPLSELHSDMGR